MKTLTITKTGRLEATHKHSMYDDTNSANIVAINIDLFTIIISILINFLRLRCRIFQFVVKLTNKIS